MLRVRLLLLLFALSLFGTGAHAQVTSLRLNSDPGDYIGGGQFTFLTPSDGTFSAQQNSDQGVSISFFGQPGTFWFFDFAAPNQQLLSVGTYAGATRFPFQGPSQPGLSVSGDGRGCNTLTGSFQVLEVAYGANNTIASFDATFEQHCEGALQALRGEIRYNAHPVVNVIAPSNITTVQNQNLSFTVSATDALSRHVTLTVSGLPSGASFIDNGNNTASFSWTPTSAQGGNFLLTFQGDNLSGNIGVTFTQISVIVPPPPNDDFNSPAVIQSIPFTASSDVSKATTAFDDPFCFGANQSVWFSFTASNNMRLEANTFGGNYDTTLAVYTGARGALTQIACNDDANNSAQSRVRFDAVAGTTYYFEVSSLFQTPSANLVFNLIPAPPPFSIAPSVTQFGAIDPSTGLVTLSGFVACTQPSFVTVSGELKQIRGGLPVSGFFSVFVPCTGTTPWSVDVQTTSELFHGRSASEFAGGKASVSASAIAFDPDTGEAVERDLSVVINLRGKN